MAKAYLVARFAKVTYGFVAQMGVRIKDEDMWNAPIFNKDAKIFTNKAKAEAYAKKKNIELHPKPKADGSFSVDISGWSDFKIASIEMGQ